MHEYQCWKKNQPYFSADLTGVTLNRKEQKSIRAKKKKKKTPE